jgi:Protein of unknown function (DUF1353)
MFRKPVGDRRNDLRRAPPAVLFLVASIACATSIGAAETQFNAERSERRAFMEKATQEQWDRVGEAVNEMAKRGIHPKLAVTTLKPFADWDYFVVDGGRITWTPNSGQNYESVVVPEGFVTDLASIPRAFWQILKPEGRHAYAAVVHDYLYWTQTRPREEADMIFRFALEDSKVSSETIEALYLAVRSFGQSAWDTNAQLRKAGECRFLKRLPADFTTGWKEWKKQPDVCAPK